MTAGNRVTIAIPMLCPSERSPNFHGRLRDRIRAVREWRRTANLVAISERNRLWHTGDGHEFPFKLVKVAAEFVVPRAGYERGLDNAIAGLKPVLDGLVSAGLLASDRAPAMMYVTPFLYTQDKDRAPLTIVTLTERKR